MPLPRREPISARVLAGLAAEGRASHLRCFLRLCRGRSITLRLATSGLLRLVRAVGFHAAEAEVR